MAENTDVGLPTDNTETPHVITRKKIEFKHNPSVVVGTLITKAISCINVAPADFRTKFLSVLQNWHLVDDDLTEDSINPEQFRQILTQARAKADGLDGDFLVAYSKSEWKHGSIESTYTKEEAEKVIPYTKEVGDALESLGEEVNYIWWFSSGNYPLNLIERNNNRRQVFKMVDTELTPDEINTLSQNRPLIIPPFEALKLSNGKTALLIEWINGRYPKTAEEIDAVESATESLNTVPLQPESKEFDLNRTNFKITDDRKVFYVDSDLVENIAEMGYCHPSEEQALKIQNGITNRLRKF